MGNVLESDSSSVSENEIEDTLLTAEIRTQGDGMESENAVVASGAGADGLFLGGPQEMEKLTVGNLRVTSVDNNVGRIKEVGSVTLGDNVTYATVPYARIAVVDRESPKQLPPRDKLIVLRPPKLVEKSLLQNSNSAYNKLAPAPTKQREPKFVPYEPYKGATRSMTEDDSCKSHSRKPSLGSSNSSGSIRSSKVEMSQINKVPNCNSTSESTTIKCCSPRNSEGGSNLNGGHSEILLKERLKIHEKDINELRTENTRLKKMLVDSLSGFGSPPSADVTHAVQRSIDANGSSMSESVDNLSDEIEVWRSKFLSSCVLVEQLTKENQDWKRRVNSAAELFRETKQNADVVLTPVLFDKINTWLHQGRDPRFGSGSGKTCFYQENDINDSGSAS